MSFIILNFNCVKKKMCELVISQKKDVEWKCQTENVPKSFREISLRWNFNFVNVQLKLLQTVNWFWCNFGASAPLRHYLLSCLALFNPLNAPKSTLNCGRFVWNTPYKVSVVKAVFPIFKFDLRTFSELMKYKCLGQFRSGTGPNMRKLKWSVGPIFSIGRIILEWNKLTFRENELTLDWQTGLYDTIE